MRRGSTDRRTILLQPQFLVSKNNQIFFPMVLRCARELRYYLDYLWSRQSRASHAYRELALVVQTLDSATG